MNKWDISLGAFLLLIGIGMVTYGVYSYDAMSDLDPAGNITGEYVGVTSGTGLLILIIGVLQIIHALLVEKDREEV